MSWRSLWLSLAAVMVVGLLGCQGELPGDKDPKDPVDPNDPYPACTDPQKCCPQDKMQCYGDPDKGIICTCSDLWDCSKNPNKCEQDMPTPDGGDDWECTWTEFKYTCTKKGTKDSPPTGGTDWNCTYNDKEFKWECTRHPVPNPNNTPDGTSVWTCKTENGKIICEKSGTNTPPTGGGTWNCSPDGKTCEKVDDNNGLPPGGSNWKCHQVVSNGVPTWICYGETPQGGTPPGGSGWNCVKVKTEFGKDLYKCERPEGTGDYPPGGGWWSCVKGSEFAGTKCEKVDTPPEPPTLTPSAGSTCKVNEKMWCDGLTYCGWGQVDCDPNTGTWRTVVKDGKTMLDCKESLAGGKVPNTVCACYHFFFNPSCCERPDCILPTGTSGQICPASAGKLCDYCNPLKPTCVEAGAKCIVTNAHETFCGRDCSSQPCPAGFTCMTVKLQVSTTKQCVPSDMSCYY